MFCRWRPEAAYVSIRLVLYCWKSSSCDYPRSAPFTAQILDSVPSPRWFRDLGFLLPFSRLPVCLCLYVHFCWFVCSLGHPYPRNYPYTKVSRLKYLNARKRLFVLSLLLSLKEQLLIPYLNLITMIVIKPSFLGSRCQPLLPFLYYSNEFNDSSWHLAFDSTGNKRRKEEEYDFSVSIKRSAYSESFWKGMSSQKRTYAHRIWSRAHTNSTTVALAISRYRRLKEKRSTIYHISQQPVTRLICIAGGNKTILDPIGFPEREALWVLFTNWG